MVNSQAKYLHIKNFRTIQGVVVHTFSPSTPGSRDRLLSSRPARSTKEVLESYGWLHSETLI